MSSLTGLIELTCLVRDLDHLRDSEKLLGLNIDQAGFFNSKARGKLNSKTHLETHFLWFRLLGKKLYAVQRGISVIV